MLSKITSQQNLFSPKVWTHIFIKSLLLAFSLDTLNPDTEENYLLLDVSWSEKPQKQLTHESDRHSQGTSREWWKLLLSSFS